MLSGKTTPQNLDNNANSLTTKITFFTMNIIEQRGLGCRVDRVGMLVELGGRTIRSERDLHKYICTYTCKHSYHYHNIGRTIRSKTGICPNKFVHVLVNTVNIVIMLGGQSYSYKKKTAGTKIKTTCQILCSMLLHCVNKTLTPRRMH